MGALNPLTLWLTIGVATFLFLVFFTTRIEGGTERFLRIIGDGEKLVWTILFVLVVIGWPWFVYDWANKDPDGHA